MADRLPSANKLNQIDSTTTTTDMSEIECLKHELRIKDEKLEATSIRLAESENIIVALESQLNSQLKRGYDVPLNVNATTSIDNETNFCQESENFVLSSCHVAQLEEDNRLLWEGIDGILKIINTDSNELGFSERVDRIMQQIVLMKSGLSSQSTGTTYAKVRMALEQERRLRTQIALEESEKRYHALKYDHEKRRKLNDENRKQYEARISAINEEKEYLSCKIHEYEQQVAASNANLHELHSTSAKFEQLYKFQILQAQSLEKDLCEAKKENKFLMKEMETLNEMFVAMEKTRLTCCQGEGIENAEEVLAATESRKSQKDIDCFNEVVTKSGNKSMVLSVSKTYIKLHSLILEKKTLEDELEKLKHVNSNLCSRVHSHEEKLFSITDELNKTWTFVSNLKIQHRELRDSEQILRAELTEKRHLLAKLRKELDFARESWKIVREKTAQSEKQWQKLRDEFATRKNVVFSKVSSESGYSDRDDDASPVTPPLFTSYTDHGNKASDFHINDDSGKMLQKNAEENSIPIFIPSFDYMSNVSYEHLPPLFCTSEKLAELEGFYSRNHERLVQSSASDIIDDDDHSIFSLDSILVNDAGEVGEHFDELIDTEDEVDTCSLIATNDVDPDDLSIETPPLIYSPDEYIRRRRAVSEVDLSDPFTSSPSSTEGSEHGDDEQEASASFDVNYASLNQPSRLRYIPHSTGIQVEPEFSPVPDVDTFSVSSSEDHCRQNSSDNATDVTRFLIKHLPRQLSKLRTEKYQLEDKIQDMEFQFSNQSLAMLEMDRRLLLLRKEADLLKRVKKEHQQQICAVCNQVSDKEEKFLTSLKPSTGSSLPHTLKPQLRNMTINFTNLKETLNLSITSTWLNPEATADRTVLSKKILEQVQIGGGGADANECGQLLVEIPDGSSDNVTTTIWLSSTT